MERKKKYCANFNVNNGTTLIHPIKGANKKKLLRRITDMAKAEIFQDKTNVGTFWVDDMQGQTVAEGCIFISNCGRPYVRYYK